MMTMMLPRSNPEAQGVSSRGILAFLAAVNALDGLHSVMLVRHGQVIAEGWWHPYALTRPHLLYSLSKSFTSTAAGFAVAEGLLSLDDTVVSFFPDELPAEISPNLAAMRVRHLLSMSTGQASEPRPWNESTWVRSFLAAPVEHEPGTHFLYNSLATYMVSTILHQVTGMRLLDYLQPRLFTPLGIENAISEQSPQGIDIGGWGMSVTTEDIAKFGLLYLNDGVWNGERVLPEGWVAEATRTHISNGTDPNNDWNQGYGFQFWRCRHGAYRGDGAFGQYCVVVPEQDFVVAITSGIDDMGKVLNLVWEHLLPALHTDSLPRATLEQALLHEQLSGLSVPAPKGPWSPTSGEAVVGKTYRFVENQSELSAFRLELSDDGNGGELIFTDPDGEQAIPFGFGGWHEGRSSFYLRTPHATAASAAWTDDQTLTVRLCFVETPATPTLALRFEGEKLFFDLRGAIGFGPTDRPTLEANLEP